MCLTLLIAAGLLTRNLQKLQTIETGLITKNLFTIDLNFGFYDWSRAVGLLASGAASDEG